MILGGGASEGTLKGGVYILQSFSRIVYLALSGFEVKRPNKLQSCLIMVNCEMRDSYSVM